MKYFIDTEFIEGSQKRRFGRDTKPTIDLISIGIVAEDGREYYAISKDFNLKEAWNRYDLKYNTGMGDANNLPPVKIYWIRDNVLKPIFKDLIEWHNNRPDGKFIPPFRPTHLYGFTYKVFKQLLNLYGKSNKQIAEEVVEFCKGDDTLIHTKTQAYTKVNIGRDDERISEKHFSKVTRTNPEFIGYYADYDWVVFCWLFGKMINLPKGFPMYCIDLKQIMDEKVISKKSEWGNNAKNFNMLNHIKTLPNYPKQLNEHNALADAKWNYELYKFLNTL